MINMINILIGIDPFAEPGVDKIYKFSSKDELVQFVRTWLYNDLVKCSNLISGKPYDIENRINLMIDQFKEDKTLKYNSMNDDLCEYEYKWIMYQI